MLFLISQIYQKLIVGNIYGKFLSTIQYRNLFEIILFQVLFILSIYYYDGIELNGYVYPQWSLAIGWTISSISLICIPIYIIYLLIVTPGTFKQVSFHWTDAKICNKLKIINYKTAHRNIQFDCTYYTHRVILYCKKKPT